METYHEIQENRKIYYFEGKSLLNITIYCLYLFYPTFRYSEVGSLTLYWGIKRQSNEYN